MAGLAYRKSAASVATSTVHKILTNRIYSGDFDFDGVTYRGTYEAIVPRDLWEQVQDILAERGRKNTRTKRFAFSGLITCGHCGRAMVGEMKKGGYVYYHCCGCPRPYTREEVFEAKFSELVAGIVFSDEMLRRAGQALRQEQQHDQAAVARLQREHRRLQDRLDAMYVDKLDGRIDEAFYGRKAAEWRAEQAAILEQIAKAGPDADINVRHLAQRAAELFGETLMEERVAA